MNHVHGHFPFAPVQFELEDRFEQINDPATGALIEAGDACRASELLGYNRKTIGQWRAGRLITVDAAEACAFALGLHPVDLWPDYHEVCQAIEDERQAAYQRMLARQRVKNAKYRLRQTSAA